MLYLLCVVVGGIIGSLTYHVVLKTLSQFKKY